MALSENPTLEEIVDEVERLNNLIVNRGGAQTITPSTSNKTLAKGYYKGNITVKGDANLVANNILSGKSIFGVVGNVIAGKRWARGTTTSTNISFKTVTGATSTGTQSMGGIYVTGLDFTPRFVMCNMINYQHILTNIDGLSRLKNGRLIQHVRLASSDYYLAYQEDSVYLGNGWFRMGCYNSGQEVPWIAFE